MKEFGFQVVGLLVIIFGTLAVVFHPGLLGINLAPTGGIIGLRPNVQSGNTSGTKIEIVSNDGKNIKGTLTIELADTPEKRGLGLGGRASLGPDNGMLFLFSQPGTYDFWMKGMQFPLDMIWIYSDQVVDSSVDVPPPAAGQTELPLYHANQSVDKVIEVNAGYVKAHNITPGDRVKQLN